MAGRSSKQRGYRSEKSGEALLKDFNFRRMPFSGSFKELKGDLVRCYPESLQRMNDKVLNVCENKRRNNGWLKIRTHINGNSILILDKRMVIISEQMMIKLLYNAGYSSEKSLPYIFIPRAKHLEKVMALTSFYKWLAQGDDAADFLRCDPANRQESFFVMHISTWKKFKKEFK